MAENMIKFLRGNVASLPQTATEGALYFTKDEGVYLGLADGSYHRYGDFITVADVKSLPAAGAHQTCMYYCVAENILAKWSGTEWTQINKQKTLAELGGVAKSVYEAKIANLEQADADNATAINGVKTLVGTLPADAGASNVVDYVNNKIGDTNSDVTALAGRVSTAEGKLTTLTGADTVEGSVAKALKDAKAYADSLDTAMDARMDVVEGSITTLTGEENVAGSVKAIAKSYADDKDAAIAAAKKAGDDAQADVDTLAGKVGTVADGKTVVGLIGEAHAAADTAKAAADAAQSDVDALEAKVGTVPADKTVVQMIADAQTAATYDDTKIKADIKANADAIGILNGTGEGSVSKQVSDAVASIVADAPEAYDTLKEISDWISSHASDASAMNSQINTNKTNIASLTALVGTLPETATSSTVIGYIDEAIAALEIGDYAKAADLTAAINRIDTAEGKITALEGQVATINGDASTAGSFAKGDADTLASAKAYADQSEADAVATAKAYTDELANGQVKTNTETIATKAAQADLDTAVTRIGTAEGKITALETASATHATKTEVDGVKTAFNEYKTSNDDAVALKANAADVYTKTEVYNKTETYTKAEVESMFTWGSF